MFFQPHQDHPDRGGGVCSAADPLPACPEAPPDAHLHHLHRRQQGHSAAQSYLTLSPLEYMILVILKQPGSRALVY